MDFWDLVKKRFAEKKLDRLAYISIFRSVLLDLFFEKTWQHLDAYLVSIRFEGHIFYIKTNKPLINSEISFIEEEVKTWFQNRILSFTWEKKNIKIKYL